MAKRVAVVLVAVAVVGAGCGLEEAPPAEPTTTTTSGTPEAPAPAPAFDPPRRFEPEGIPIGSGQVAVADGVAYTYSDTGLEATELATGSPRWSVRLAGARLLVTGPMAEGQPPGVVTDEDGETLVVAAYGRYIEGTGTQEDSSHTAVVAVDSDGEVRWEVAVESESWAPRVVGELDGALVLDIGDTVVLDVADGSVRWTGKDVKPAGVDGDAVIGVRAGESDTGPWTTVALRGTDGGQVWAGSALEGNGLIGAPPELTLAGPGRAIVSGQKDNFDLTTTVIDTATGKEVASIPEFLHCEYDDRDTAVCSDTGLAVGVDVATGKQLWQLPDEAAGRTGIEVTAAFHGAVYGEAQTDVILDARTGADLVTDAEIAPTQVFPGYGFVTWIADDRETVLYRATG